MLKNLKISSADSRTIKTLLRTKKMKKERSTRRFINIDKQSQFYTPSAHR